MAITECSTHPPQGNRSETRNPARWNQRQSRVREFAETCSAFDD